MKDIKIIINKLEDKVKDCNNTNSILNTNKYVLLEDVKQILLNTCEHNFVDFDNFSRKQYCTLCDKRRINRL